MPYQKIILKKEGKISTITLNRPEVLNALDGPMLEEIIDAIQDIEKDPNIWVVVFDSNCKKAFSAGTDVKFVKDYDPWAGRSIGKLLHRTFGAIRTLEKPVIAAIDGLCLGAGLELAISCDILIATDRSQFGLPNINVGIPAIVEAAILLPAIGLFGTKELCFTGKNWDAQRAQKFNLLNSVVPPRRATGRSQALDRPSLQQITPGDGHPEGYHQQVDDHRFGDGDRLLHQHGHFEFYVPGSKRGDERFPGEEESQIHRGLRRGDGK